VTVRIDGGWENIQGVPTKGYECGFCGNKVASERGWQTNAAPTNRRTGEIRVCPRCNNPTVFRAVDDLQLPGVRFGSAVQHLAPDAASLYEEARDCFASGAYTGSVMLLRKLLMHVAVEKGAKAGLSFFEYVEYLDTSGYLGRDGKGWVDMIRKRGNEANHEIVLMKKEDGELLLSFAELLLKLLYEFPGKLPKTP
jgi:hypothetical protein